MSGPEHGLNPETAIQMEYARHYGRFYDFLERHGERLSDPHGEFGEIVGEFKDRFFILPRLITQSYGFFDTQAVTIESEFVPDPQQADPPPEIIIRTLELGQEGLPDSMHTYLARKTWAGPARGAWFWRETKITPPVGGLSRAGTLVSENMKGYLTYNPGVSPARLEVMRQIYPYFERMQRRGQRPAFGELRLVSEMIGILDDDFSRGPSSF
ncbi:MAG TPA: hypothetical protein VLA88_05895 [Candidatus Saccharimonadales bacterium]|nr:hypothetical protein [Candidatus Saccharimonadales bacterium]